MARHPIDITQGADKCVAPMAVSPLEDEPQPPGIIPVTRRKALSAEIAGRMKPTHRRLTILSAHFIAAMTLSACGKLRSRHFKLVHISVFCHVVLIVLLAEAIFYVTW